MILELEAMSQAHVPIYCLSVLKVVESHNDKERTILVRKVIEESLSLGAWCQEVTIVTGLAWQH